MRVVDVHPEDVNIFVSGSYDHTVKLWDCRQAKPVFSIKHKYPVESCIMNPSGSFLITAGKNEVNVLNVFGGGSCVHTFCCHQRTSLLLQ